MVTHVDRSYPKLTENLSRNEADVRRSFCLKLHVVFLGITILGKLVTDIYVVPTRVLKCLS